MRSRIPWIIWWAIFVHIAWGYALTLDPGVLPVAILVGLHWLVAFGLSGPVLGLMLIAAALLAAASLLASGRLSNHVALSLLMPQYALLVAAFVSDAQSVISGQVASAAGGVQEVDRVVLFTVLCPVMIAALLHSLAIIERHTAWNRAN